jgi:hypothetical protein
MPYFKSHIPFSEILENTLASNLDLPHNNQPNHNIEWSSDLDPMHLSYLLGTLEIDSISPVLGSKNPYLKYKKTIVIKDHNLSQTEQSAFELINSYLIPSALLPKNFHLSQLKRCYKKAALRTHPDCGGSHESFLKLKTAYELLVAFLNSVK